MSAGGKPEVSSNGRYDIAVVGAGSAGFSAAITACGEGAKVALIGSDTIGGTCVNVGCIPSKTLIRAMASLHDAKAASRFAGIAGSAAITDWSALIRQKDDLVSSLRQAKYTDLLPAYSGLTYIEGSAHLMDGGVTVNEELIRAPKVILATGARPAIPAISGIEDIDYLTSTSALELKTLPKSLLVIGGGYIGSELAQTFARAGVAVSIACRSRLLPQAEPEISEALARYFKDEGIEIIDGLTYDFIEKGGPGTVLRGRRGERVETLTAESVLIATGRTPNTRGLGLKAVGVALNGARAIKVDAHLRTTRTATYAAGDVTGNDPFVYMAAYGAKVAALNALNGDTIAYDNRVMPTVVFTDPQVASTGLTETQARLSGYDVMTRVLPLDQLPRALAARDVRGLIKLVADVKTNKLLGAHILAPEGADCIQTAVIAIKAGMTVCDLAATIFPYLTTVEGLKLAAQTFDTDVKLLSCCAG